MKAILKDYTDFPSEDLWMSISKQNIEMIPYEKCRFHTMTNDGDLWLQDGGGIQSHVHNHRKDDWKKVLFL